MGTKKDLAIGIAIRNFILSIEDKDERLIFLTKIQGETTDRRIVNYCDELREFLEGDSCDSGEKENVPCGTESEVSLDSEDEGGGDEDYVEKGHVLSHREIEAAAAIIVEKMNCQKVIVGEVK